MNSIWSSVLTDCTRTCGVSCSGQRSGSSTISAARSRPAWSMGTGRATNRPMSPTGTPGRQLARLRLTRRPHHVFVHLPRRARQRRRGAKRPVAQSVRRHRLGIRTDPGVVDDVDDLDFYVVSQYRSAWSDWSHGRAPPIGDAAGRTPLPLRRGHRPGDDRGVRTSLGAPGAGTDYRRAFEAYSRRACAFLRTSRPSRPARRNTSRSSRRRPDLGSVVTKRGAAHDELRAVCNAFCGQCARRLRAARLRRVIRSGSELSLP